MSDYENQREQKPIAEEAQEERVERMVRNLGLLMWGAAPGFKITTGRAILRR